MIERERSVLELAERSHYEEPHATQVRRLALELFDQIGERVGCDQDERQTLADAALLHDIGYQISYEDHHKHSYRLILDADLRGISPSEQVVIANVARYHRGASPKQRHRNLESLDKPLRQRIKRLAAILRVADGFDRGHAAAVGNVRTRWTGKKLRLHPELAENADNMRLELWGAARKADLLEEVLDAPVEIVAPDGGVVSAAS